jgi:hypothetical protein
MMYLIVVGYVGICGAIARVSARFQRLKERKMVADGERFVKICPIDFFLGGLFFIRRCALAAAPRSCQTHLSERKKPI